jgi:hypothetical protein
VGLDAGSRQACKPTRSYKSRQKAQTQVDEPQLIPQAVLHVLKDINAGNGNEGPLSAPNRWGVVAAHMAQKRVWNSVGGEEERSKPAKYKGESATVSQLLEGVDGECSKWALKSDRQ